MLTNNIKIVFEKNLTNKEAILRQLSVLYGTRTGEQALDRGFGLDWSFLDQPIEVAKAMLSAEIITKTNQYVPSVSVSSIDFTADINGNLTPTVSVEEVENE
jgi:phage baseplate assembly protein W